MTEADVNQRKFIANAIAKLSKAIEFWNNSHEQHSTAVYVALGEVRAIFIEAAHQIEDDRKREDAELAEVTPGRKKGATADALGKSLR